MNTGDILLFESSYKGAFGWWGKIVSIVTRSKYTHVAIVLKDPYYVDESFRGLYVLESGSEEWAKQWGTIISPLSKVLQSDTHKHVYLRRLHTQVNIDAIMPALYNTVMDKAYDINPIEILGNELRSSMLSNPRQLNRFVCSSLVGYIYTALGLLPKSTSWFYLQPRDFSSHNPGLPLMNATLSPEECLDNAT